MRRPGAAPTLVVAAALVIAACMLLPVGYLALRVFEEGASAWDDVTSATARQALSRTMALAAAVTSGSIVLGVSLGWLTARTDLPLRRLWAVLLALPLAVPSYVGAYAFVAALGPRGMLQDVLSPLGVETLPEIYGFRGAWLVLTIFTFPYVLLPVRAALRGMDRSLDDAARGLGASRLESFRRVTLPQLRPAIAAGGILVALYTLSDFGAVSILRFDSLSRIIYVRYTTFDRGSAAAFALVLVALTLAVVIGESMLRGKGRYHASSVRTPPAVVKLGKWKWPAVAYCGSVVVLSLVLPISVIAYWLVRAVSDERTAWLTREAMWNSLSASGIAAIVAVAAALPIAILAVRYPGILASLIEKAAYTGYALPGITIALALVFFAANYAPSLYQTLPLLIFAYTVRFLPQALGSARGALLQVNPNTEDAARGLGKSRAEVFGRITLPQILPGLTSGGLLVFLTVMKELPVTLLVSPIGFDTLATQVWSATSEAFFARAALTALLLVGLSAIPVLLSV
jgi:iron(III) transport system permease protein